MRPLVIDGATTSSSVDGCAAEATAFEQMGLDAAWTFEASHDPKKIFQKWLTNPKFYVKINYAPDACNSCNILAKKRLTSVVAFAIL